MNHNSFASYCLVSLTSSSNVSIVDSIAKSSIAVPTSGLLPLSIAALTGGTCSGARNVLS